MHQTILCVSRGILSVEDSVSIVRLAIAQDPRAKRKNPIDTIPKEFQRFAHTVFSDASAAQH
ncbi:hypothetical protein F9C07_10565 [Aspergillus flavus]|uniref:Uncharacterized protein n=1 Tax=Aspergillus flavus (strain ATCC 200026 / FGSC A1120 / IAM 13836 / NRRL 3357 / JCM 12722 / SRRC 167) TaxID=332952 RepID=A0A7U2R175_ASPFN|nr:hypothetical protein F9C07_10565 [Aspergillus flavus]